MNWNLNQEVQKLINIFGVQTVLDNQSIFYRALQDKQVDAD
jgi:hypothetical protein